MSEKLIQFVVFIQGKKYINDKTLGLGNKFSNVPVHRIKVGKAT